MPNGEIDLKDLYETMARVISEGRHIAAVIAVGRGTLNLVPDPISKMRALINSLKIDKNLVYSPYLHVDSVITWAWLCFETNPKISVYPNCHPNALMKIRHVRNSLEGIKVADSFAADFHKTSFCPYGASVFISKDKKDLYGMSSTNFIHLKNYTFGEYQPFKQTFENSRSSTPVVSIWAALRRLGLSGFRNYIIYQQNVCEVFKSTLKKGYADHFEVINNISLGWKIIIKPHSNTYLSWQDLLGTDENKKVYT